MVRLNGKSWRETTIKTLKSARGLRIVRAGGGQQQRYTRTAVVVRAGQKRTLTGGNLDRRAVAVFVKAYPRYQLP
jgi:hypothetical protein